MGREPKNQEMYVFIEQKLTNTESQLYFFKKDHYYALGDFTVKSSFNSQ